MDGISSQAVAVRDGCCDGGVTLNVEVVPGLYYAADSAATIEQHGVEKYGIISSEISVARLVIISC